MPQQPQNLTQVLNRIVSETEGEETSIKEILAALEDRSFSPLLAIPALFAIALTGAIPGMSLVTGSLIVIISAQMLISQRQPWLPKQVLTFSFSHDKLASAMERIMPWIERSEPYLGHRLEFLRNPHYLCVRHLNEFGRC